MVYFIKKNRVKDEISCYQRLYNNMGMYSRPSIQKIASNMWDCKMVIYGRIELLFFSFGFFLFSSFSTMNMYFSYK